MELPLEAVALFSLKLVYETEGQSPLLRDDPAMDAYQREVFALLVRNGDVETLQCKVNECLVLALDAVGGAESVMGRELQKLADDFRQAATIKQLHAPLIALKDYLKAIQ